MPRALSRRELLLGAFGAAMSGSLPMRPATAAPRPTDIKIASAGGGLNLAMAQLMRQEKFLESFDLARMCSWWPTGPGFSVPW